MIQHLLLALHQGEENLNLKLSFHVAFYELVCLLLTNLP